MTPTARSLAYLRRCQHQADVVERWLPRANVGRDLSGCINLVAVRRNELGKLIVEFTTRDYLAARVRKNAARLAPDLGPGFNPRPPGWGH
jgi:hypothetical protein